MKDKKAADRCVTALVLGGGGARGAYEIGVWQALRLLGIEPDMVFGTSVGSINAAMIAQDTFDLSVKLWKELETDMVFDIDLTESRKGDKPNFVDKLDNIEIAGHTLAEAKIYAKEIVVNGGAGNSGLRSILEKYVSEEAVRSSRMEYGLATVEIPTLTVHYMRKSNIPKGLLIDYILASSAVFPAIKAQDINGRKYIDGGFADVIPVSMAIESNADRIISVNLDAMGIRRKLSPEVEESISDKLITIESYWDLGNVLLFDRKNSARLINLGFLDALKVFGVLQGEYYAFPNGEMDKRSLKLADAAAKVFDLDPERIYKKEELDRALAQRLQTVEAINLKDLKDGGISAARPAIAAAMAKTMKAAPEAEKLFSGNGKRFDAPEEIKAAKYLLKANLV